MQGVRRAEAASRRRRRGRRGGGGGGEGGGRGGARDAGAGMVRRGGQEEEAPGAGAGPSSAGARPPQAVRVKRELLAACMTCPLCHKLFRDATTISECLHTFCRKCIYEKLTDEEVDSCPICNIDLGCSPVEKLRPDHNLQDVRAKIFPFKRRKVKAPEIVHSISLPGRRKERSLSSLVVSTPRVATQGGLTGRRTKPVARKASALRGLGIDDSIKKENNTEDYPESSSSAEILSKMAQSKRQSSFNVESSDYRPSKDIHTRVDPSVDKTEMWKPLNCLVEAANRTKSIKFGGQSLVIKSGQTIAPENEVDTHRNHPHKGKLDYDKNNNEPTTPVLTKARRMHGVGRKRAASSRELGTSTQALLDAANVKHERRICPIWFSLISVSEQEEDTRLPQIPACYLRIKDASLPVSFIQKYIAMKLDLASETEVEITCRGQPVVPTLALHKLVDLWLQAGSSQKAQASIGTSAKDFVMVLAYARKLPATLPIPIINTSSRPLLSGL